MKDLKAKAAERAHWQSKQGNDLMIDIIQHIRNVYTDGEKLDEAIETRIKKSFNLTQDGISWMQALSDEE